MGRPEDETQWTDEHSSEVRERPSTPPAALVDNRYRLVDHLGSGAMGVVYRAEDVVLGRPVALKVLGPAAHDLVALARFRKEACTLAQLRHENVVQIYALGEHRGAPFIAMQYVDGQDLRSMIREHAERDAVVPRTTALRILRDVARGLGAVHAHSLVHRDVKPSNIVIEKRSGRPILIDFGLARRLTASSPKLSVIGGTPSYMAPEQAADRDGSRVSARSDLYSFACTAFELLTGRAVFEGETGFALLVAHAKKPAPRISSHRAELAAFDDVFARALAKRPEERQPSCAAFVHELEEASRHGASPAPSPPLRVLLLAPDEGLRAEIAPVVTRAFGAAVEIVRVERDLDFARAFERLRPELVLLDDDTTKSGAEPVAAGVRHAPGGCDVEIFVLGGNHSSARLEELGARELAKPLNTHVLGLALTRIAARMAERRARAARNEEGTS